MFSSERVAILMETYGNLYLLCIFLWTFLEGETIIILSGAAAKNGLIELDHLILTAWAGAFMGDQLYFYIGRRWGGALLQRFSRLKLANFEAIALLERYSVTFILTYRFIYGVRNVSPFAIGMSSISWGRFAAFNLIAAGIWAIAFSAGGYLVGAAMEEIFGEIGFVLAGAILVLIIIIGHRQLRKS